MFYEQRTSVPDSPTTLRQEYDADFASIVASHGVDAVTDHTQLSAETVAAIETGASPSLTLTEAAHLQAMAPDTPPAETIETMACEHLLLGMSSAILDVDAVAATLDLDLDPKEIQQKIERRAPMTFDEFVHIQYVIAAEMA
jgi:hypothetical protein